MEQKTKDYLFDCLNEAVEEERRAYEMMTDEQRRMPQQREVDMIDKIPRDVQVYIEKIERGQAIDLNELEEAIYFGLSWIK